MASTGGSEAKNNPHGMDNEIWAAINAKFDPVRATACMAWIGEVCEEAMPEQGSKSTADWFALALKDGYYLTKLMLTLHPDFKKNERTARKWKPKHEKMAFKAMESVSLFGKACKDLGMAETDVVTSQDVFQMENPNATLCCLYGLNAIAQDKGWTGPLIAGSFSHATETKRNFTEEQLKKGKNVMSKWSEGSIHHETGGRLDGSGIVKTAGSEGHKVSSEMSTWQKGSTHHEGGAVLDHIVRTQPNKDWVASNEIPAMSKGTIAHESNNLDGYGIVRRNEEN